MAAKIIMVVKNQNSRVGISRAPEIRCCQPADAAANDYQIVVLVRVPGCRALRGEFPITYSMSCFEGAGMASAQPS
jgi:hypothetical protein